jgi:hypothetical protein
MKVRTWGGRHEGKTKNQPPHMHTDTMTTTKTTMHIEGFPIIPKT